MTRRTRRTTHFWFILGLAWLAGVIGFVTATAPALIGASPAMGAALVMFGLASSLLWLGGIRHAGLWLTSHRARVRSPVDSPAAVTPSSARVALLYCTADDFSAGRLAASMRQDHPVTTVILDDSASARGRADVDQFAAEYDVRVLRRARRSGFKAGNLNHAIARMHESVEYVVVLDSDEVIPPDFVRRALGYFADKSVGVVQSRHRARPGPTRFSRTFSGLLGTHISTTQPGRARVGLSSFMGRGAMISLSAYRAAGGIPEVVCEDIAFSVAVRDAGYRIAYAHELVCEEDYPVDYLAFRTQHLKTTQGAVELLMRWRRGLRGSTLQMHERVDAVLDLASVPTTATAGLTVAVAGFALTAMGGLSLIPIWAAVMTGVLAAVPLLPEATRLLKVAGPVAAVRFFVAASALFSSTLLATVWTSAAVILGRRAVFRVTPKRASLPRARLVVRRLTPEIVAAGIFATVALVSVGTIAPAVTVLGSVGAHLWFTGTSVVGRRSPSRTSDHLVASLGR